MKQLLIAVIIFNAALFSLFAQKESTVSGYIRDAATGEALIGATVFVDELNMGTVSNEYGFYSLSLPYGTYNFTFSYVSYQSQNKELELQNALTLDVELSISNIELESVVIYGERQDKNVTDVQTGVVKLSPGTLKTLPVVMGEQDILKSIQLMPGIQSVAEGNSGYSVRGGSPDQNLIQLDEAPVYNAGHMFGFFSVFNSDAIKDATLYKGDIPASSGGKLASLLDVRMKDGNRKEFHGEGGIGLIASRLTLEGPIKKDKSSFIVSGRRTYADIFLPLANDSIVRNSRIYFYDLNAKLNFDIDNRNKIFLSAYSGKDFNRLSDLLAANWGNTTVTARWNHLYSGKLFSNLTLIHSRYNYLLQQKTSVPNEDWNSQINITGLKYDFSYFNSPVSTLRFGVQSMYQYILPAEITTNNNEVELIVSAKRNLEHALYLQQELKVGERLGINWGLRATAFQNIGDATEYTFDNFVITDTVKYGKGDVYNTYFGLEPRFSANYMLTRESSVKASYSRTRQYIQRASNSMAGTPIDVWFSASPYVKPQISDQISAGYYRNFSNNQYEFSVEGYYKTMKNQIDFVDNAEVFLNEQLEKELRFGDAYSYGVELLLRRNNGRLNGWISYAYSRAIREFEDLNNGKAFNANFDKPHSIAIVLNYDITKRIAASANWIYYTGNPITYPAMRFNYGGTDLPVYGERNKSRMPDYHRLDLSVTLKGKQRPGKRWYGEWNISLYNAYNRSNAYSVYFERDEDDADKVKAYKLVLYGMVPSITYNFRF